MLLAFKMRHLRENLRFPLPSCFSAHYYPPHHSKVTSWQMLLTVCRCPVLKYKLPFSLKSPSISPRSPSTVLKSPWLHGHNTLALAQRTYSALKKGLIVMCPLLKETLFWLPLNIRLAGKMWAGWRRSREGPQR